MMRGLVVAALVSTTPTLAQDESARSEHAAPSPYAGEQHREIKSLSPEDVTELERGGGWRLALPAELNGVPGRTHLPHRRYWARC